MIAAMGDDNLLALLIGKKVNAQHFAAGANLTLYVGRDVAGSPPCIPPNAGAAGLGPLPWPLGPMPGRRKGCSSNWQCAPGFPPAVLAVLPPEGAAPGLAPGCRREGAAGPPPGARRFRRRALGQRFLLRHGASFLFVKLYCTRGFFSKKACSCWKKAFTSPMPG